MYKLSLENNYLKINPKQCPYCGKLCKNRNSFTQHTRLCSQNPTRQMSNLKNQDWAKGLTKETDERIYKQSKSEKAFFENHNGHFKGKKHSKETKDKISISRKKYLQKNPNKVPYLVNHSSKTSYPEQYFIELFKSENIDLDYHLQVSKYELDFYNLNKMIDVEIDGEQHYVDERIVKSDVERTNYLQSLGWKIFRVRWSEYQKASSNEKLEIINKIKELIT